MSTNIKLNYGLEREFFVGDQIFEDESERIFRKSWICVARQEDFEDEGDSFRTIQLGADNLIVVRLQDGTFRAFHNLCRHRGTRLIDTECGTLKNSCVTCPYHAWTYDLQGSLIGAPNMHDVAGFDRDAFGLHSVGCVNWCGFIMIHLESTEAGFETDFAPLIERLKNWELENQRLAHTLSYDINANWKLVFQNYSECYHCPTVHPSLNRLTPYKSATNDLVRGAILGGPMELADDCETVSLDGKRIGASFPGLSEQQCRSIYYYTVFPCMFVSAHPDYVMVHQLERISNDNTLVKCHFLVPEETRHADLMRAVKQWDEVNREDWHVCELTQRGIASPAYQPGPYSNLESMLVAFDQHYRCVMNG